MKRARDASAERRRLERKAKRHETRREAILDAAKALLVERGIEQFTIAAVAQNAGVSKSAVYYYFESKEELIGGLAERVLRREHEVLGPMVRSAESSAGALVALVRGFVDHHLADLDSFRVAYVWPQVMAGAALAGAVDARYPFGSLVLTDLRGKLADEHDNRRLHAHADPDTLARMAFAAAHGIVASVSAAAAAGHANGISVDPLKDEACRALARASQVR